MPADGQAGFLPPYRVLDLTDEKGSYCGKLLADLGADVIKIEPPGGDKARSKGPFHKNDVHPEKSLGFLYFNTSKGSITLNIEDAAGRDIFKRLVEKADVVVETFPVGYLASLGLDYKALRKINPRLVMTSITPFGQQGPDSNCKATDINIMAMSGYMQLVGEPDQQPLVLGGEQSFYPAAQYGAVATMTALFYRDGPSGAGQHVDVSMQEAMITYWHEQTPVAMWQKTKQNVARVGAMDSMVSPCGLYPCKDGFVSFLVGGGQLASISMPALVAWMAEEGKLGGFEEKKDWSAADWAEKVDYWSMTQETIDVEEASLIAFFADKTKVELHEQALKRRIILYPASTTKDLVNNTQLKHREFFVGVEHPEVGEAVTYVGGPYRMSGTPWKISRRAPLIGEHNNDVYGNELGLSGDDIRRLADDGVI